MIAYLLVKEISVLVLMMISGWILVKTRVLQTKDSHILSVISIYLICPLVIINAFQVDYSSKIRDGFLLAAAAAVLIHVGLLVVCRILSMIFHLNIVEKASIIYSNAGNLIIPLVTAVLGREWVIYASAYIMVQQMFFWSHCQSLMTEEKNNNIKKILTNINVIAIFIGLILFIFQIKLPDVPSRAVSNIASMIGPASMIMLGMIFAGASGKELIGNKRLYLIVFLKMLLTPGIVLLFLKFSGLATLVADGKTILLISFLATMTPAATSVTQICQLYNREPTYAGAINLATTATSILTMPLMIILYSL